MYTRGIQGTEFVRMRDECQSALDAIPFHSIGMRSTTMAEGEEEVLAEFPGVRHKKQDGILLFTSARVAWSSGELFSVNHPYHQIKAQRISAESSSKVQLQLILHSGASVNFHFTGGSALEERNKAKQLLQQVLSKFSLKSNPELEAKTSLLNSDPALYQLYKDLVMGGLISAEEFWSNRLEKQKHDPESSSVQETGLPSAFLADVQAVSDGCNAVKYNLTTDVIQVIFRTYPSVKERHAELVPATLSEGDFWVQFFQSQLFHRDSTSNSEDLFMESLTREHKNMLQKETVTTGLLNTAESDTLGEGYSVHGDCESTATPLALIQRCNHHSSMVLKAIHRDGDAGSLPSTEAEESTQLDAQLRLKPVLHTQGTSTSGSLMSFVAQELATWVPQQQVDTAAAHSAVGYLIPGGALMPSGYANGKGSALTHSQREQLFKHQAAIAELLRHFWACFPVLSPQLEEKAHHMSKCLHDYQEQRLPELVSALGPEETMQQAINHLRTSISVALERYQSWQSKRNKS